MIESPLQHEPNQDMTSTTNLNYVPISDSVPELTVLEMSVSEQIINN